MISCDSEVIHIIQDHALMVQFLDDLCTSIQNPAVGVPNFIPLMNDGLISDRLTELAGFVRKHKHEDI